MPLAISPRLARRSPSSVRKGMRRIEFDGTAQFGVNLVAVTAPGDCSGPARIGCLGLLQRNGELKMRFGQRRCECDGLLRSGTASAGRARFSVGRAVDEQHRPAERSLLVVDALDGILLLSRFRCWPARASAWASVTRASTSEGSSAIARFNCPRPAGVIELEKHRSKQMMRLGVVGQRRHGGT